MVILERIAPKDQLYILSNIVERRTTILEGHVHFKLSLLPLIPSHHSSHSTQFMLVGDCFEDGPCEQREDATVATTAEPKHVGACLNQVKASLAGVFASLDKEAMKKAHARFKYSFKVQYTHDNNQHMFHDVCSLKIPTCASLALTRAKQR